MSEVAKGWVEGLLVALTVFAVCATIATLIVGAAGSSGREPLSWGSHSGPLPTGVHEITPRAYLSRDVSAESLCSGGTAVRNNLTYHGGSEETAPTSNGTFTLCYSEQRWNQHLHPQPKRPNFGGAIVNFLTGVGAWVFGIISALILIPLTLIAVYSQASSGIAIRKKKKLHALTFEDQRTALAAAYAEDKIDAPTFERKLEELMRR